MLLTVFDMVNMAEYEQDQLLQDVGDVSSGDDEGDAASVNSAGSQRDAPHPQYTVEPKLENADDAEQAAQPQPT